jgi:hypothetical protein
VRSDALWLLLVIYGVVGLTTDETAVVEYAAVLLFFFVAVAVAVAVAVISFVWCELYIGSTQWRGEASD